MRDDEHIACPLCEAPVTTAAIQASSGTYRHCRNCELVFQAPRQLPDRDAEYAQYLTHDNRIDDPRYRQFLSQLAAPMMQRLAPGAEGLDFGAGPGPALAAMFTESGFPAAVYDSFFAPHNSALERRYDFVSCTEVIEHLHKPRREFELFDKLLRPGGWLGLMTELRPELQDFAGWYYHRDPTHVSFYSKVTIGWIAQHFDWQIEQLDQRVILLRKSTKNAGSHAERPAGRGDP